VKRQTYVRLTGSFSDFPYQTPRTMVSTAFILGRTSFKFRPEDKLFTHFPSALSAKY